MTWMMHWPFKQLFAGQFSKADAIDLPSYDFESLRTA